MPQGLQILALGHRPINRVEMAMKLQKCARKSVRDGLFTLSCALTQQLGCPSGNDQLVQQQRCKFLNTNHKQSATLFPSPCKFVLYAMNISSRWLALLSVVNNPNSLAGGTINGTRLTYINRCRNPNHALDVICEFICKGIPLCL